MGSHILQSLGEDRKIVENCSLTIGMSGAGRLLERGGQRIWHVVDAKGQVGLEGVSLL